MKSLKGSALLVCDVWNRHWCKTATEHSAALAVRINDLLERLRPLGAFVVHAPSDTMKFYEDYPQRILMAVTDPAEPLLRDTNEPPAPRTLHDGCPDNPPCERGPNRWPWTRQHPAIRIDEADGITDVGTEVYSVLRHREIEQLIFAGVHTDICILDRSFGIRQMRQWGVDCALLGDLTEAFFPRETSKILDHIDRHLCPVISSADLI